MFNEEVPSKWGKYPVYDQEYVAVYTTYSSLKISLPNWMNIGMVRYINSLEELHPRREQIYLPNCYEDIMWKEKIKFEWEEECRAVVYGGNIEQFDAENFFEAIKDKALVYAPKISLSEILQGVWVHPSCTNEHHDRVNEKLTNNGFLPALK